MMSDNKNALASYVTFRQLFKSNTNEIFSIIKKFIEYIIVCKCQYKNVQF